MSDSEIKAQLIKRGVDAAKRHLGSSTQFTPELEAELSEAVTKRVDIALDAFLSGVSVEQKKNELAAIEANKDFKSSASAYSAARTGAAFALNQLASVLGFAAHHMIGRFSKTPGIRKQPKGPEGLGGGQ